MKRVSQAFLGLVALSVPIVTLILACSPDNDPADDAIGTTCDDQTPCPPYLVCTNNVCAAQCNSVDDCQNTSAYGSAQNLQCIANVCIANASATSTSTATSSFDAGNNKDSGSKTDSGNPAKLDSGIKPDGGSACPGTVSSLPVFQQANTAYGLNSCSSADISAFRTAVGVSGSTPQQWYDAVSGSCKLCIFSGESDSTWQLIVLAPDLATGLAAGANATGFLNIGPCYQEGPGGSVACARGVEDFQNCVEDACPSPQCDSNTNCDSQAETVQCASEVSEYSQGCGSNLSALNTYCDGTDAQGSITDFVNAVCGNGSGALPP